VCDTDVTRVAAIDCGTNSIRLLVADIDGDRLVDLVRRMEIVRLGEGVDRTGRLSEQGLQRTFAALDDYAAVIQSYDVDGVRMVATSATRDAANRSMFVDGVRQRLGVAPEVVSGDEEAVLSFDGATRELRNGATAGVVAPYLVCDIGGGSTEFVLGDHDGMQSARSVDVGCVRLTERHLHDDPPLEEQIERARADVRTALADVRQIVDVSAARTLVGLAGSVTTVVALALGLDSYQPDRIHHARVDADVVRQVTASLLSMSRDERAALPVMHPGRVDVIGAGALVLDTIVDELGLDAVVASEHDILDGIAFSAATRR
jgi:exopolyphosphatase / guanosine-5'-triphosphate,3'-diphosphate pyrophosphatase